MRSRWYGLSRAARAAAHQFFSGHGHALEAGLLGARKRNRTQRPSTEQPEVPPSQPVSSVRAATSPPVPTRWVFPPSYSGVIMPPPDRNPVVNWESMMGFPSGVPPSLIRELPNPAAFALRE